MTFSDLQTLLAKRIALIKRVHKTSKNADTGVKMIQQYYGSRITNKMSGVLLI